jgi:hypothetical protein
MPDLSSPETCIKPYENRPRRLIENPFLPTLKPEEPLFFTLTGLTLRIDRVEPDDAHAPKPRDKANAIEAY